MSNIPVYQSRQLTYTRGQSTLVFYINWTYSQMCWNKLWIVYSKWLRGNFFPAEFVHDVWLKHVNTKKASVWGLCVCANQMLAKCTLEFGQLQDTVADSNEIVQNLYLACFLNALLPFFSSTTRFGSAARAIYLQATCLINLWLKGFNEAESAGWAFFWMI